MAPSARFVAGRRARRAARVVSAALVALVALLAGRVASAHCTLQQADLGYAAGCANCHSGGAAPTVTLSAAAACVQSGKTVTISGTISAANGGRAGLGLSTSAGTLTATDPNTVQLGAYVAQLCGANPANFSAVLTTGGAGTTTVKVQGLSSNSNGGSSGDGYASATTTITVCANPCATFYLDNDGDGYGDPNQKVVACTAPAKYVADNTDCDDGNAAKHPGATEICDGLDNNCNGQIDENNPGGGVACATGKLGVCSAGISACTNGAVVCNQSVQSSPEVCDGLLDENCNGQVDEGCACVNGQKQPCYSGAPPTENVGLCHGGTKTCVAGQWTACSGEVLPAVEVCNALDDDCNGQADDGNPGGGAACNTGLLGVCKPGKTACLGGAIGCKQDVQPSAETCNGLDDDCNGQADDGNPGGGLDCASGKPGVCSAGTTACASGAIVCNAKAKPSAETCNGLDDDCDGQVDDATTKACYPGPAGTEGVGACRAGWQACLGVDGFGSCAGAVLPVAETCNGVDDDCNGKVDDGDPGGGFPCDTGKVGACKAGVTKCDKGAIACVGKAVAAEACDGIDGDCDGVVDNGCVDTDGDGASDGYEAIVGTDPLDPDSDDDGLFDGTELGLGCDNPKTDVKLGFCRPDADHGATVTNPLDRDTDHGGASDGSEDANLNGARDPGEGDPTLGHGADDAKAHDADGDGLSDALEAFLGTDPMDADSDDDGVIDGAEPNPSADMDHDGLVDALDPDSDDDGLFDGTELGKGCLDPATDTARGLCRPDADEGATTTDPLAADTDRGGALDGSEDANLNGRVDPGETDPTATANADDGLVKDADGDGLSDGLEAFLGSDPKDADSDDDGVPDGKEPNPSADLDGDGLVAVLDVDADDDGLFDGTELGYACDGAGVDAAKKVCVADADQGATTTSAALRDTDRGGASDASEDVNRNGRVDDGEGDPTAGHGEDDAKSPDGDGDGLSDALETAIGTDPADADSDDDGVPDGREPNPTADGDGDGRIDALDADSDGDGLFDGTELGRECSLKATDPAKKACIPDADRGTTRTSPLVADTDHGGVKDGDEDASHDGVVDVGETDPTAGHGADDKAPKPCTKDADCGGATSGKVCDASTGACHAGCRGAEGNGCPAGLTCSSSDATAGTCAAPTTYAAPPANEDQTGSCAVRGASRESRDDAAWLAVGGLAIAAAAARRRRR